MFHVKHRLTRCVNDARLVFDAGFGGARRGGDGFSSPGDGNVAEPGEGAPVEAASGHTTEDRDRGPAGGPALPRTIHPAPAQLCRPPGRSDKLQTALSLLCHDVVGRLRLSTFPRSSEPMTSETNK